MSDHVPDLPDDALQRLPRYTAPARLRVAIVEAATPRPRHPLWLSPLLSALATAMALVLFVMPVLPRIVPADPVQRYVRAVVSEHSRTLMWGTRHAADIVPTGAPWLTQESGIAFARAFAGDDRLTCLSAEPVYLERHRGIAMHYRDQDGHMVTYVALPAPALAVPDRHRVQVGRWRPALVRDSGFASWVWKEGEMACFLVSDMVSADDLERFKQYFIMVRAATQPVPAY